MGSCRNRCPEWKTAKLVFRRAELLYDVENYSFVEGDIMQTGDEHARHQVLDIGEGGNADRVARVLDLAYVECVEMLYPYTKEEVREVQEVLDDVLTYPEEYVIGLRLPAGFSFSTLRLLKELVHEYLVCRVLADWMSITNPGSRANWEEKADRVKAKIHTSLLSRAGKVRRKPKPF